MKFHVYRAQDGFVLSPECMQAPMSVQNAHPAVCECGSLDLPVESAGQVFASVTRDGFAVVDRRDVAYGVMDFLCRERSEEIAR